MYGEPALHIDDLDSQTSQMHAGVTYGEEQSRRASAERHGGLDSPFLAQRCDIACWAQINGRRESASRSLDDLSFYLLKL